MNKKGGFYIDELEEICAFIILILAFIMFFTSCFNLLYTIIGICVLCLFIAIRYIADYFVPEDKKLTHGRLYIDGRNRTDLAFRLNNRDQYLESSIISDRVLLQTLTNIDIPMYIIHDLEICINYVKTHIDFVVVTRKNIFIINGKNYNKDIFYYHDKFEIMDKDIKREVTNPLNHTKDEEIVLNAIFKQEGINTTYKSLVVLTNNDINLYCSNDKYDSFVKLNDLEHKLKDIENATHFVRNRVGIKRVCDAIYKYNYDGTPEYVDYKTEEKVVNEKALEEALLQYRIDKSKKLKTTPGKVLSVNTINDIVVRHPKTIDDLSKIYGMNNKKIEKFGNEIVDMVIYHTKYEEKYK